MKKIYVLASDRRFDLVARGLEKEGFEVFRRGCDTEKAVYLLAPSKKEEEVLAFFDAVPEKSTVFLARDTDRLREEAKKRSLSLYTLSHNKDYLFRNSLATAEGVLEAIIAHTDSLLSELQILVTGYGNCGSAIAELLSLAGGKVWVFSREGSMARARDEGFRICPHPEKKCFDVIVNTVPAPIFGDEFLSSLRHDALFLQIASGLSGLSEKEMARRGVRFLPLPGLPGKVAPRTEADAILRFVTQILKTKSESE